MIPSGQIFVIGDSHIGLSDGSEAPILAWLDRFAALQPRALYLNGDLFHYLIADPKFYTSSVENVFARFRDLRDSGIASSSAICARTVNAPCVLHQIVTVPSAFHRAVALCGSM